MERKLLLTLVLILCIMPAKLFAQNPIENLVVETYYIADSLDATDTLAGRLEPGSVTYRIFLDLQKECKLRSIFGTGNHPFVISGTSGFFNHKYFGKSVGNDIKSSQLKLGTLALDSWLAMGYATNKHMGELKAYDPDTSIVGGNNNTGGSAHIPGGLLVNDDTLAGIPLTTADGLVQTKLVASDYTHFGITDIVTTEDTTIFGDTTYTLLGLTSTNIRFLTSSGFHSYDTVNRVLLAQLTTKGELAFNLNVEVIDTTSGKIYIYVAEGPVLGDTLLSAFLKYPPTCGCTDPYYVEYDPKAPCDDGSCKTLMVLGCGDSLACNYNPDKNVKNVRELCCYNSACDRNLEKVCPGVTYGCTDPDNLYNYNPEATSTSNIDTCCYVAGCMDNRFIEYDPKACFDDGSYCKVYKLNGCMDKGACNYNPFASINSGCIYGCADTTGNSYQKPLPGKEFGFRYQVYPNPTAEFLNYTIETEQKAKVAIVLCNTYGTVLEVIQASGQNYYNGSMNLSERPDGVYFVKVFVNEFFSATRIIKN